MASRLHTKELLNEYLRIFKTDLKTPLSLVSVQKGEVDWLPPEALANKANGIWIVPSPAIRLNHVQFPKALQVSYGFRVVYVQRIITGENMVEKRIDDINTIIEKMIDKYELPDLELSNGQVLWSFPMSVEMEPPEDTYLAAEAADLMATAFNLEVEVRTNHR